jgi:hypothetical protein
MCKLGYIICVCKICLAIQHNNLSNCVRFSQEDAYFLYENTLIFLYTRLVKFFLWCTFGTRECIFGLREIKEYSQSAECSTCFRRFSANTYAAIAQYLLLVLLLCVVVWCCVWNMHHIVWKVKGKGSGMENMFYSYLHTHMWWVKWTTVDNIFASTRVTKCQAFWSHSNWEFSWYLHQFSILKKLAENLYNCNCK